MDFATVCSGIEAPSIALGPLGWKAEWFSEIEPFPCALLEHRFPETTNHGDMTKLPALVMGGQAAAPSVLIGGTPCQAFSVAGMRKGLIDPRGALTIKFVELADAVDVVRGGRGEEPSVIWWENVPGVLSDKENAFGCFLAALVGESEPLEPAGGKWTDAGAVYGPQRAAAWRVLDAQYFGLAQRRRRVFVVASARKGFDPASVLFESEGVRRDIAPSREKGEEAAGTPASRTGAGGFPGADEACSGYVQPVTCMSHGVATFPIQNATRGKSQNGLGIATHGDPMYTLDQGSQHAVAVALCGREGGAPAPQGFRMAAFGEYSDDGTASTMKARDYKDATDLVVSADVEQAMSFQPGNLARGAGSVPSLDVFPTLRAALAIKPRM